MTIAFLPSIIQPWHNGSKHQTVPMCSGNVQSYVSQQLWSVRVWVCARACNQQLKTTTTTINFLSHIKLVVLSLHFTTTHLGVIIIIKWPRRACQAAALFNWNAFHGACMGSCAYKVVKTLPNQSEVEALTAQQAVVSSFGLVLLFGAIPAIEKTLQKWQIESLEEKPNSKMKSVGWGGKKPNSFRRASRRKQLLLMLSGTPRFARVTLLLWHRCQVINRHLPWHGGATDCRSLSNNSGCSVTPSRSQQFFFFLAVELLNSCVVRQLLTTAILEIDWSAWDESLNEESILEAKTGREEGRGGWGGQGKERSRNIQQLQPDLPAPSHLVARVSHLRPTDSLSELGSKLEHPPGPPAQASHSKLIRRLGLALEPAQVIPDLILFNKSAYLWAP